MPPAHFAQTSRRATPQLQDRGTRLRASARTRALLIRAGGAGAVVSVALLGETMPDYFGTFDVAMFSLFSVTGGEPWPESLPRLNEDGTANWGVMLFCSGYFVITTWLILQVLAAIPSNSRGAFEGSVPRQLGTSRESP